MATLCVILEWTQEAALRGMIHWWKDSELGDALLSGALGIFGVLVGAGVSWWRTAEADRDRRMMELAASYLRDVHPKEGSVLASLSSQSAMSLTERLNISYVGDWFEVYAAVAMTGRLSQPLRERIGLDSRVKTFWDTYVNAKDRSLPCADRWSNMRALRARA